MRFLLISAIVLVCTFTTNAQNGNSDRCVVKTLELTGKKIDEIRGAPEKALGSFETVIAEEKLTTRVYRLPQTKLFVIASVWYTDESLASKQGAESISLDLMISKSRHRNLLNAQHFADAEVPYNGFEVARVATIAKSAGKTFVVVMECRSRRE